MGRMVSRKSFLPRYFRCINLESYELTMECRVGCLGTVCRTSCVQRFYATHSIRLTICRLNRYKQRSNLTPCVGHTLLKYQLKMP